MFGKKNKKDYEDATVGKNQNAGYTGIVISILVSLLLLLVGVLMIFLPNMEMKYFAYVAGGFCLGCGVALIVRYFSKEEYRLVNNYDFSLGILASILGLCIIVRAEEISDQFMTGLGILILIMGVIMFQHSIQMLETKSFLGRVVLVFAILILILSVLILLEFQISITTNLFYFYITLIIAGSLGLLSQILVSIRLVQVKRKEEKINKEEANSDVDEQEYVPKEVDLSGLTDEEKSLYDDEFEE